MKENGIDKNNELKSTEDSKNTTIAQPESNTVKPADHSTFANKIMSMAGVDVDDKRINQDSHESNSTKGKMTSAEAITSTHEPPTTQSNLAYSVHADKRRFDQINKFTSSSKHILLLCKIILNELGASIEPQISQHISDTDTKVLTLLAQTKNVRCKIALELSRKNEVQHISINDGKTLNNVFELIAKLQEVFSTN